MVPAGAAGEDGRIPDWYRVVETDSPEYPFRTECNVLDSNATLIVYRGELSGGTSLTLRLAAEHGRPCLAIDLDLPPAREDVQAWLQEHGVRVLNVAGPRAEPMLRHRALVPRFFGKSARAIGMSWSRGS